MASNKTFRFGPIALTNVLTTNLLNPPGAAAGVNAGASPQYIVLKHLRITNKTAAAVSFSLWLGATGANAAGTEVIGQGKSVPANDSIDWYGILRLDAPDFLVGGAGAAAALSITGEGEIGVAG
jgi:hypothetical protein